MQQQPHNQLASPQSLLNENSKDEHLMCNVAIYWFIDLHCFINQSNEIFFVGRAGSKLEGRKYDNFSLINHLNTLLFDT
jgi:hypothetical protein